MVSFLSRKPLYSPKNFHWIAEMSMLGSDLSKEYGPLLPARPRPRKPDDLGYDDWEKFNTPHSLIVLNDDTSLPLRLFMKQIEEGWPVGRTLFHDVILIWLVDESGRIFIALEELVVNTDQPPLSGPVGMLV